jgi:glycosyltransferase involved in cell wall biosynthesis
MTGDLARTHGISVAISTRHRADALGRCLTSIRAGTLQPEAIVVVDQSSDDTTERLVEERIAAGLPIRYRRVAPRGLGASQNVAVSLATTEIVAITDDDCVVDPRWLETLASAFETTPPMDLVGGAVHALPAVADRAWPVSLRTSATRLDLRGYAPPWTVGSGNNFAVRRETFLRLGGCDERLGPGSPGKGGVDTDLFYRFLRAGARVRYEPAAVVLHERQRYEDRLARRPLYGHGVGAGVAFRLRDRDAMALRLLLDWSVLRLTMLGRAAMRREWRALREEVVMLGSTARGLAHGLRAPARDASVAGDAS